MELMNKTRVTDSLAVVIGLESIEVLVTEGFLFDVAIRFVKVDETNLDQGNEKPVFTPEYKLVKLLNTRKNLSLNRRKIFENLRSKQKKLNRYLPLQR
ncbi:Uncharacterised protein [Streptococcus pneumoniae]|nr:Uncharacterised protein [Streptococcus pneumoniae]